MESIEFKARNYDEALAIAQEMTGKSLDELDFKCIREPIFFIKGLYRVTIEEDTTKKEKANKNKPFKNDVTKSNKNPVAPKSAGEKPAVNNSNNGNNSNNNTNKTNFNNKNNGTNNVSPKNNNMKKPFENSENKNQIKTGNKPETKPVIKEEIKKEPMKEDITVSEEPSIQITEDTRVITETHEENPTVNNEVSPAELDHFIRNYIEEFARVQGVEVEVESQIRDGNKYYILNGSEAHKLIGYHGENLNAMQILIAAVVNEKYATPMRILLDIEQYKTKREESLKALARRTARKVISTRRSQKLEPMNANERRIIHSELQSNQKVTTESHGTEPHRFVVIKLK